MKELKKLLGRGRGFTLSPGSSTLDRRPSRILVSGYELDEKDDLLVHFQVDSHAKLLFGNFIRL